MLKISKERLKVPEVVIGEPVTFMPIGVARPIEVTVPEFEVIHVPSGILKQPPDNWMPLEKVELAVADVMFKRLVWMPPAKVEVAVLVPTK